MLAMITHNGELVCVLTRKKKILTQRLNNKTVGYIVHLDRALGQLYVSTNLWESCITFAPRNSSGLGIILSISGDEESLILYKHVVAVYYLLASSQPPPRDRRAENEREGLVSVRVVARYEHLGQVRRRSWG